MVFSGVGDKVLNTHLEAGDYIATLEHDGESNFIVYLYDSEDGRDLLVNKIGEYSGETLVRVGDGSRRLTPGPVIIEVNADGNWIIEISK